MPVIKSFTIRGFLMIKLAFCLRRKPSLTVEEFQDHWLNTHAPLVRKHQKALRIMRYVQLHTDYGTMTENLRRFRGAPEPFDGIAELWYESREVLEGLGDDPAARVASRELREDEERFVDLASSPIWIAEEKEIIQVSSGRE